MRDPTSVHHRTADEVDVLARDEILEVPDGVEDLAQSEWGRRVTADKIQRCLVLPRCDIFEREQSDRLESLSELSGRDGAQAMMGVVAQVDVFADVRADRREDAGCMSEICAGVADLFGRTFAPARRFVAALSSVYAIDRLETRDPRLCAHGSEAACEHFVDGVLDLLDAPSSGVG